MRVWRRNQENLSHSINNIGKWRRKRNMKKRTVLFSPRKKQKLAFKKYIYVYRTAKRRRKEDFQKSKSPQNNTKPQREVFAIRPSQPQHAGQVLEHWWIQLWNLPHFFVIMIEWMRRRGSKCMVQGCRRCLLELQHVMLCGLDRPMRRSDGPHVHTLINYSIFSGKEYVRYESVAFVPSSFRLIVLCQS